MGSMRNVRTYWLRNLTGGSYEIGIASDAKSAAAYIDAGYIRITREDTMLRLTRGPAQGVYIDSLPLLGSQENFAKALRGKKTLAA